MQLNRVGTAPDHVPVRNVLISVAEKAGIEGLAEGLWRANSTTTIYSTGGTYSLLEKVAERVGARARLRQVSEYTGQPEMQGGLVKTLDYRIYLGLLAEADNPNHRSDITRTGSVWFDAVVCNFYPFEAATARAGTSIEDARTHIDIGGPTMIRAAAKNFLRVAALHDPRDYSALVEAACSSGTTLQQRFAWARSAFAYVADYDRAIAKHLSVLDADALAEYTPIEVDYHLPEGSSNA